MTLNSIYNELIAAGLTVGYGTTLPEFRGIRQGSYYFRRSDGLRIRLSDHLPMYPACASDVYIYAGPFPSKVVFIEWRPTVPVGGRAERVYTKERGTEADAERLASLIRDITRS